MENMISSRYSQKGESAKYESPEGLQAFFALRKQAEENGLSDMGQYFHEQESWNLR